MAKKNINIRLEETVWFKAKEDDVHNHMTLQDWVTHLILNDDRVLGVGK